MRLTLAALALATGLAGFGAAVEAAPARLAPKPGVAAQTHVIKAKMTRKRHVIRHKAKHRRHVRAHRAPAKAVAPRS